jgi:hypothetical protein
MIALTLIWFRFFYEKPPFRPLKSVSISFGTFVDAAGVAAISDGMVCPSPKVLKVRLST